MTELHEQIRARVSEALTSLQDARTEGDDHMVEVRTGELESLAHLAARARPAPARSAEHRRGRAPSVPTATG